MKYFLHTIAALALVAAFAVANDAKAATDDASKASLSQGELQLGAPIKWRKP
jgi:hypothetical protein